MDSVKSKMNNLIDSMKEQLFEMGDAIYDHPEIGLQEVFASKLLEDWLENHGFLVERGLGSMPTAFRAVYEPVSYTHLDVYKRQHHYHKSI